MSFMVQTVTGMQSFDHHSICDAHTHVWISSVEGVSNSPVLDESEIIERKLHDYRQAGGSALLDCQPPLCGRDSSRLVDFSRASGVYLAACTGYHRRRYYSEDIGLWKKNTDEITGFFLDEIVSGLIESRGGELVVYPGFIKGALEFDWQHTSEHFLLAAVRAACESSLVLMLHTERGRLAAEALDFVTRYGLAPEKLILCHMDKRPDKGLHSELAREGVFLEYDTFLRSGYDPDSNVWPLLDHMLEEGFENQLTLATDMASITQWQEDGPSALITVIREKLQKMGLKQAAVDGLCGGTILRCLAKEQI